MSTAFLPFAWLVAPNYHPEGMFLVLAIGAIALLIRENPRYQEPFTGWMPHHSGVLRTIRLRWGWFTVLLIVMLYVALVVLGHVVFTALGIAPGTVWEDSFLSGDMIGDYPWVFFLDSFGLALAVCVALIGIRRVRWADLGMELPESWASILEETRRGLVLFMLIFFGVQVLFTVVKVMTGISLFEDTPDATAEILEAPLWVVIVAACILAPVEEELAFRGVLYPLAVRTAGPVMGVIGVSAAFSFLHPGQSLLGFTIRFLLGVFLIRAYEKTRSLWGAIALHSAYNLLIILLSRIVS